MRKLSNKAALELVKELVEMERLKGLGFHELVKELGLNEQQEQALLYRYELSKTEHMRSKGAYRETMNPLLERYKKGGEKAAIDYMESKKKKPVKKEKGLSASEIDSINREKYKAANISELHEFSASDVEKLKALKAEGVPYRIICGFMGAPENAVRSFVMSIKTPEQTAKRVRDYALKTGRAPKKNNVTKLPVNRILCSARLGASL